MVYRPKPCIYCEQLFEPLSSRSKLCPSCKQRTCVVCGQNFTLRSVQRLIDGHANYCSPECYLKGRWGASHREERICPTCSRPFIVYRSDDTRFCSLACSVPHRAKERNRQIRLGCDWCGTLFYRAPSNRTGARVFCCHRCSALWWAEYGLHGKQHPRWRGGPIREKLFLVGWKAARRIVLERADGRCERCSIELNKPKVHHITPRRECNSAEEANEIGNLIALCSKCHAVAEKESR